MNTEPHPSAPASDQNSLAAHAEKLLTEQMERCSKSSDSSLSGNAAMLIAASFALQVARGDENISSPQIDVGTKPQSFRAAGIGFAELR